jgi:hypothetical protein
MELWGGSGLNDLGIRNRALEIIKEIKKLIK